LMSKTFAPQYERDEHGWILFPGRDTTWRRQLFPEGVFDHPAKANMYLVQALIEYLTEPGDTIVDPFAGTGTLLVGALMGRNIALIELEHQYLDLLNQIQEKWEKDKPIANPSLGRIFVFEGDCRQRLQDMDFLCDASIFSPPYSNVLSSGGETGTRALSERITPDRIQAYGGKSASSLNLGRLNPFYFEQAMNRVLQRLLGRLVPNAPIALIAKDAMQAGKRLMLSEKVIRQAQRNGFKLAEWFKWKQPMSSYRAPAEAKGIKTVEDEDILVFRKES